MRVLYLTYDGLTDPLGRSQIIPYLVGLRQALPELAIDIISFEKPRRYNQEGIKVVRLLAETGLTWHPLTFHERPPILAKAYDLQLFRRRSRALFQKNGYNLIHARSYVAGWIAYQLSQRHGCPWIFDMRGFWVDERRENGQWPAGHWLYDQLFRLWKQREARMIWAATHLIVLTEAAKEVLRDWGIPSEKVSVIPCAADYTHFALPPMVRKNHRKAVREALGVPDEALVLIYAGSIGPHYATDTLLKLFAVFLRISPNPAYLVVLTLQPAHLIHAQIAQLGIPQERVLLCQASYEEVPRFLSAADIGIATVKPAFSKQGMSPTKLAEYLAADLPVIINNIGDTPSLSKKIPGLFIIEDSKDEYMSHLAKNILNFIKSKRWGLPSLSEASRPLFGLEAAVERYASVYQRLRPLAHSERE